MERETHEVENRWRNKYMNLGRELGKIINGQQDRILSLTQENNKLKKELWNLKSRRARNGSKTACNRPKQSSGTITLEKRQNGK